GPAAARLALPPGRARGGSAAGPGDAAGRLPRRARADQRLGPGRPLRGRPRPPGVGSPRPRFQGLLRRHVLATQSTLSEQSQYLGFHIAGEEYAIGILRVREILEYDTVTRVPTTPASIRGVINLRGSVVPVVDLAVKLGLAESVVTKRSCVVVVEIVLEGERTVMGL